MQIKAICRDNDRAKGFSMKKMKLSSRLSAAAKDQRGATAVEYGLILALICLAVLGGISALGGSIEERWNGIANSVAAAA